MYTIETLFDLNKTMAAPFFRQCRYPWEILPRIGSIILQLGTLLPEAEYEHPAEQVWIAKSAVVAASASITGPCIIGPHAEIRHCAFIRGNALIGADTVVGNSTELKNVILFDEVQVPHFNYVGDSVLGYRSHMGAGAITSNVKSDKRPVTVRNGSGQIKTGLIKFGAILGDNVEVGCGSVMNPGTIIGKNTSIYPLSSVRGIVPENSIYKHQGEVVERRPNE